MTRFRVSASATVAVAAAVTTVLVVRGGDPRRVVRVLERLDEPVYAAWYAWLVLAPVVLLATALVVRRSAWPWTAAATAHLGGLVAAATRFEHWMPTWGWPALVVAVGIGLWSVAEALCLPTVDDGSSPRGRIR